MSHYSRRHVEIELDGSSTGNSQRDGFGGTNCDQLGDIRTYSGPFKNQGFNEAEIFALYNASSIYLKVWKII